MKLLVTSVDYNPPELADQVPFALVLGRQIPGPDRPDYWIGKPDKPIRWFDEKRERLIGTIVVCARWAGTEIGADFINLPIGIAYVTDPTLMADESLDFSKCRYVAIGTASVTQDSEHPPELIHPISGRITAAFGLGKSN